jgi:hypothetical protein
MYFGWLRIHFDLVVILEMEQVEAGKWIECNQEIVG